MIWECDDSNDRQHKCFQKLYEHLYKCVTSQWNYFEGNIV
jgi:hypothetical protein